MARRVIAHGADCPGGTCPTTYDHPEPGMVLVQGYVVTDPAVLDGIVIPDGEAVVAVPESLLARHIGAARR